MKRFFFFLSLLITVVIFSSCDKLQEPKLTEFEKQQIISNYDWRLISPNGNTLSFITKKSKVVFVFVWSTKDENIERVLDNISELYEKYNTKMEFVFVTSDKQVEVRKFLESNKYSLPVFFSLSPISKPMNLEESKKGYLISKKGRIVVANEGDINWNSKKIHELIDGLLKQ